MQIIPNPVLIVCFFVVSLLNNFTLSYLADLHAPTGQTLLGRGIVCVFFSIILLFSQKEKMLPRSFRIQFIRFVFAALGLWCMVESYHFAKASEIALVSRLDVPIIVLFGSAVSLRTFRGQKAIALAILTLAALAFMKFGVSEQNSKGLVLSLAGTLILAMSFILLSRTARTESAAFVSLTPAVACIACGMLLTLGSFPNSVPGVLVTSLTAISGAMMFATYAVARQLYRRYRFLKAQMFYALIPIFSIPIDLMGFGRRFSGFEYVVFAVMTALIAVIGLWKCESEKEIELTYERDKVTA